MVFTCGSAMTQGKDFFAASAQACRVLDRPGLLLTPYSEQIPFELPGRVRHVPYVRLDQLLPLVHHGGVGTMAAGIAAGVPQLVVPMAFDQPDNAQRLTRLGLGASMGRSAYRDRQAAKVLARLIGSTCQRSACQAAAAKIDRRMGVDAACDAIEAAAGR